jgi:hypothetical protein
MRTDDVTEALVLLVVLPFSSVKLVPLAQFRSLDEKQIRAIVPDVLIKFRELSKIGRMGILQIGSKPHATHFDCDHAERDDAGSWEELHSRRGPEPLMLPSRPDYNRSRLGGYLDLNVSPVLAQTVCRHSQLFDEPSLYC